MDDPFKLLYLAIKKQSIRGLGLEHAAIVLKVMSVEKQRHRPIKVTFHMSYVFGLWFYYIIEMLKEHSLASQFTTIHGALEILLGLILILAI